MPILPPEPFIFPNDIFAGPDPSRVVPNGREGEWFVAHTKSRSEKALARWLLSASVQFFLPLYKKKTVTQGRHHTSYVPLFPGYLFVWGDADARYEALGSNQVANCLPVYAQARLASDLANVYRLMRGDLPLTPAQNIPPGTPVEVTDGPFAGMAGTMVRAGTQTRLIVSVKMINQGVSVELDRSSVRPLTTENGRAERARLSLIRA